MKVHVRWLLTLMSLSTLALGGCSDSSYDIQEPETVFGKVDFTVVNLTIGEEVNARSAMIGENDENSVGKVEEEGEYTYIYYPDGRRTYVYIPYIYYEYNDGIHCELHPTYQAVQQYTNTIIAGGNNKIQFTFRPSCPEEKMAVFTFPGGEKLTVDAADPTCVWTLDRDVVNANYDELKRGHFLVKAESVYQIDNVIYVNEGYIWVHILSPISNYYGWLEFDRSRDVWEWLDWDNTNPNRIRRNVDFTVKNITVGQDDYAEAAMHTYHYSYYGGIVSKKFNIETHKTFHKDSTSPECCRSTVGELTSTNTVWSGMNNELKVTYRPISPLEKEATFYFPDGSTKKLTRIDNEYVWSVNSSTINSGSGDYVIRAVAEYAEGDKTYESEGYVVLMADDRYVYDSENSFWLRKY